MKKLLFLILAIFTSINIISQNAQLYNEKGWDYYNRAEYEKALASFKNSLNENPQYLESLIGLAEVYFVKGAYNDAYEIFNNVSKQYPDNVDAVVGTAKSRSAIGDYENAFNLFSDALKISINSKEAHFGLAEIYYLNNKIAWAERKLDTVFKLDPYHYKSLLLMARIKSDMDYYEEALVYVQKAIDGHSELPDAYLEYGRVLLQEYFSSNNQDYLADAIEEIRRALSIYPDYSKALELLGRVYFLLDYYDEALEIFERAEKLNPGSQILKYCKSVVLREKNLKEDSMISFENSYLLNTSNEIVKSALENFLVKNDISFGNPSRVQFSKEYFEIAKKYFDQSLIDRGMLFLRRSIYMNPLNREARVLFADYNNVYGYERFYIDELKKINRFFPENETRQKLDVSVIKRRDSLYFKEGYGTEDPVRDVPKVFVADFISSNHFPLHMEGGSIIADEITFSLNQFGRMKNISVKDRMQIMKSIKSDLFNINDFLDMIADKYPEISNQMDYLVYGNYSAGTGAIKLKVNVMDFKTGVVINEFEIDDKGKNFLQLASLRAAKRIYASIPFRGRILKYGEEDAVINLGSYDGVKNGDLFYVNSNMDMPGTKYSLLKKIIFTVEETNTIISKIKIMKPEEMKYIKNNDRIFPVKQKRAKKIK